MRCAVLMGIMILSIALSAAAGIPKYINYSGKIMDKSGYLLEDGEYDMEFRLYDGETGPEIWCETHHQAEGRAVQVVKGTYNIQLGKYSALGDTTTTFASGYYIEMKFKKPVDSTYEVFSKQPLSTTPYSIRSKYANQALQATQAINATNAENATYAVSAKSATIASCALNVIAQNLPGYLLSGVQNIVNPAAAGSGVNYSGVYSPATDVRAILVEMIGPGGGGGGVSGGSGASAYAGGGGAGGYCRKFIVSPAASYAMTIGCGGDGGEENNKGSDGSSATTFGSPSLYAGPGIGGAGIAASSGSQIAPGGDGGSVSGGDLNACGSVGRYGLQINASCHIAGVGGDSLMGGNPKAPRLTSSGAGYDAPGCGAGGTGAASTDGNSYKGGKGANGLIIIWEYK